MLALLREESDGSLTTLFRNESVRKIASHLLETGEYERQQNLVIADEGETWATYDPETNTWACPLRFDSFGQQAILNRRPEGQKSAQLQEAETAISALSHDDLILLTEACLATLGVDVTVLADWLPEAEPDEEEES